MTPVSSPRSRDKDQSAVLAATSLPRFLNLGEAGALGLNGELATGGEFDQLLADFWHHYAPQGPVEEMLVERMATLKWRLARVYRSERGEIVYNHALDPECASERDCLPNARVSDRLVQYETMLERAIYRALTQLERLQRSRRMSPPASREEPPREHPA